MKPLAVAEPVTLSRRAVDGTRLDASVWRPAGTGRWPVLLMRQAYGRAIASSVVLAHPAWYAAHGYVVMVEDVRGTGTSEGPFSFLGTDMDDGADALEIAAGLAGSDGTVGMYGFSYQGIDQFLAIAGAKRRGGVLPRAIAPAMATMAPRDLVWEGGAIRLELMGLALQYAVTQAERAGDVAAHVALRAAAKRLPLDEAAMAMPEVARRHGTLSEWANWLADDPAYWAARSFPTDLALDVPTLVIAGQMDAMLAGGVETWRHLERWGTARRMILGPWQHIPWGRRAGIDLGADAAYPVDAATIAWFDRHLKGAEDRAPTIEAFDLGARRWRVLERVPSAGDIAEALHLAGTGLAATASDGRMLPEPSASDIPDRFVHDPWRPVPAMGGPLAGGMVDRAATDARADVAVYTGPAMDGATGIGGATLELAIAADSPSFDVAATLSMVSPDGAQALALATGFRRVVGAPSAPLRMEIGPVVATPARGWRLRVSIAGAAWPAFTVNTGRDEPDGARRLIDARPITLAIEPTRSRIATWRLA